MIARIILKTDLKDVTMWSNVAFQWLPHLFSPGFDSWPGSRLSSLKGPTADFCEHGYEPRDSITGEEILHW